MESNVVVNNLWGHLKIQIVGGQLRIVVDSQLMHACTSEETQQIRQFFHDYEIAQYEEAGQEEKG